MSEAETISLAVEIAEADAKAAGTIGFQSRIFCQVALPYRDPGLVDKKTGEPRFDWVRKNGSITLRLRPGLIDSGKPAERYAFPFGVIPRYLLTWIATEVVQDGPAVQDDGLTLDLGISMQAFLRQIGINTATGGKMGSATRLRDQITRLAYATITVTETRELSDGVWNHHGENFGFIRGVDLWWSDKDLGGTGTLWPNTIRLTQEWRDSIKASAVPLDTRGLALIQAAKAGPMALDLYTWLAHRMFTLRRTTTVPWALLAQQFGGQYDRVRDFKAHLIKALPVVKLAYPGVNVSVADEGLVLVPSPLPVRRN